MLDSLGVCNVLVAFICMDSSGIPMQKFTGEFVGFFLLFVLYIVGVKFFMAHS